MHDASSHEKEKNNIPYTMLCLLLLLNDVKIPSCMKNHIQILIIHISIGRKQSVWLVRIPAETRDWILMGLSLKISLSEYAKPRKPNAIHIRYNNQLNYVDVAGADK